jgi:hypothetical protein
MEANMCTYRARSAGSVSEEGCPKQRDAKMCCRNPSGWVRFCPLSYLLRNGLQPYPSSPELTDQSIQLEPLVRDELPNPQWFRPSPMSEALRVWRIHGSEPIIAFLGFPGVDAKR